MNDQINKENRIAILQMSQVEAENLRVTTSYAWNLLLTQVQAIREGRTETKHLEEYICVALQALDASRTYAQDQLKTLHNALLKELN